MSFSSLNNFSFKLFKYKLNYIGFNKNNDILIIDLKMNFIF